MRSHKKSFKSFCTCASCCTYPYMVSVSNFTEFFTNRHNLIKLCWNKSKKIPRLNNEEQKQAIGMLNAGMSATAVSQHFGWTRKTIERLQRRFRITRNVADCPRSGRPRVTTAANDRYIVLQHQRNRLLTAAATWQQYGIHPQTMTERSAYSCVWSYFCQILTRRHRTARLDWCCHHLHFQRADWDLILFSDESV